MANRDNERFNERKFGESLEEFEIAKLRRKYEALGYEFKDNFTPRRKHFQTFQVDAYAINRKTGDEIVFEVKSTYTHNKQIALDIRKKREDYLKWFPKARFVLVAAREEKPFNFEFPQLAELILKSDTFQKSVSVWNLNYLLSDSPHSFEIEPPYYIEDLECTSFSSFEIGQFNLKGSGYFRFWIKVENEEFKGKILYDGLPFDYEVVITFFDGRPNLDVREIKFDYFQF